MEQFEERTFADPSAEADAAVFDLGGLGVADQVTLAAEQDAPPWS